MPLGAAYYVAFQEIEDDPRTELIVAIRNDHLVGTLQLTVLPNITYQGARRGQIEGVRVRHDLRGTGIGVDLVKHAIQRSLARDCRIVQLTTDKTRPSAIGFYEQLGFRATHEGMKLWLDQEPSGYSPGQTA